jgi:GTP-binding protein
MLGRRGEDQRFRESRPATGRRRAIEDAMPQRTEAETRADVARRIDAAQRPAGPMSYEIGSTEDPDAQPDQTAPDAHGR